jgi:hypothetical protein
VPWSGQLLAAPGRNGANRRKRKVAVPVGRCRVFEIPVHDIMGVQGNALQGGKYKAVILQGCADLEANEVHAAPKTKCVGSETVRATDD